MKSLKLQKAGRIFFPVIMAVFIIPLMMVTLNLKTDAETVSLPPVAGFTLEKGCYYIKLSCKMISGVDGVEVYRSSDGKNFELINRNNSGSYKNRITVEKGSTPALYYYKLRYYKNTESGKEYSAYSKVLSGRARILNTPIVADNVYTTASSVTIGWKSVKNADGYIVYRYNPDTKHYVKVKATKRLSLTDTGVKQTKKYYYKVRAYKKIKGTTYYSEPTGKISVRVLSVPTLSMTSNRKTGKTKVSWKAVKSATAYQVYVKETGGEWQLKKETTSLSYTFKTSVYPEIYVYVKAVYRDETTENSSKRSSVESINEARVKARLVYLETVYAPGRYWNNGGVSDTPCYHEGGIKYCNKHLGAATWFTVGGWSTQCNGFACMMSDAIFGNSAPICTLSSWDELRPGNMIRLCDYVHSLTILTKTDTYITVAECNGPGGGCVIDWHRKIYRSVIEGQEHIYISRYPDAKSDGTCAVGRVDGSTGIYTTRACTNLVGYYSGERVCIINSSDSKYYYVSTTYGQKGWILKSSVTILFNGNE